MIVMVKFGQYLLNLKTYVLANWTVIVAYVGCWSVKNKILVTISRNMLREVVVFACKKAEVAKCKIKLYKNGPNNK